MVAASELQVMLNIERRLTAIECRLSGLEKAQSQARQPSDAREFFKGLWGKGIIILLLLAAQVPMKDALLAVLR